MLLYSSNDDGKYKIYVTLLFLEMIRLLRVFFILDNNYYRNIYNAQVSFFGKAKK